MFDKIRIQASSTNKKLAENSKRNNMFPPSRRIKVIYNVSF